MNHTKDLFLVAPSVLPPLDNCFRPAVLANRVFRKATGQTEATLAIEQADGSIFHHKTTVFPAGHPDEHRNFAHLERLVKFLLWSRGGFRVHVQGADAVARQLGRYYSENSCGIFDADIMGRRIYERPFEIVAQTNAPPARSNTRPLGRHLEGCRIGFDLGGSDRKVAAVIDGKAVFSEEVIWNPVPQSDPQWHYDQIMDLLRLAAAKLPRVDAIGGSSAGVYVENRVKVASLFRGVPPDLFESRVKNIFLELKKAWGKIPFEVANDGEVTALAGSMALQKNGVLGIALGTSMAGGYVNNDGNITTWLNELAFAPIDYQPEAPADEWSGDFGCGVQYFSQQCVGRLLSPAGIKIDPSLSLPEKLKEVQRLMAEGDPRARAIYETIGVYLGYALAHYREFYEFEHLLLLGRVTSGEGGTVLIEAAQKVLRTEFPELADHISIHVPDEKDKRHGQAIAAASLPRIGESPSESPRLFG